MHPEIKYFHILNTNTSELMALFVFGGVLSPEDMLHYYEVLQNNE